MMKMAHVNKNMSEFSVGAARHAVPSGVGAGFPRPGFPSGSDFPSDVGAYLVGALSGIKGRSREGQSQGLPLQQIVSILFLLFISACSGCNKTNETGDTDSSVTPNDTDTAAPCTLPNECRYPWQCIPNGGIVHSEYTCDDFDKICCEVDLDGGTGDTDVDDTDTWMGYKTDAGVWEWEDIPPGPDCGTGCNQLTFEGATGGDDFDVWGDMLVYVNETERDRISVVNIKNRKKLKIPYIMQGCTIGEDKCWQKEVTIYENTIFYKSAYYDYNNIGEREHIDQIIKVDLEKKTQEIIWSRKWPDGVDNYPAPYNPDTYGDRLVYMNACEFTKGIGALCLFESPWSGEENHSVLKNDGTKGPRSSIWDNILVVEDDTMDKTSDIYGYYFDTKKWFTITSDGQDQYYPRIHKNLVVWSDWKYSDYFANFRLSTPEGWEKAAVFAKDIKTEKTWELTNGSSLAKHPDVFDDIVVWLDYKDCPEQDQQNISAFYCSEIYGYNLKTEIGPVKISELNGIYKNYTRIWGDRIFIIGSVSDNGHYYYSFDVPDELKTP